MMKKASNWIIYVCVCALIKKKCTRIHILVYKLRTARIQKIVNRVGSPLGNSEEIKNFV